MQKVTKRYQLLTSQTLMTYFPVNGKAQCVTFDGGITKPEIVRGRFVTSDQELQAAIEASNGFNKDYYLEQTDTEGEPEKTVQTPVTGQEDEIDVPGPDANIPLSPEQKAEEDKKEDPVVTEPETGNTPGAENTNQTDIVNAPQAGADAITDYPDILTIQDARTKLMDLFPGEFTTAVLVNTKIILKRAEEKKISFSKLSVKKV